MWQAIILVVAQTAVLLAVSPFIVGLIRLHGAHRAKSGITTSLTKNIGYGQKEDTCKYKDLDPVLIHED